MWKQIYSLSDREYYIFRINKNNWGDLKIYHNEVRDKYKVRFICSINKVKYEVIKYFDRMSEASLYAAIFHGLD